MKINYERLRQMIEEMKARQKRVRPVLVPDPPSPDDDYVIQVRPRPRTPPQPQPQPDTYGNPADQK